MISYERIKIDSPHYQAERELRNALLLRPIGLPDSAWEMHDNDSFHFVALEGEDVVGCVVLYPIPSTPGRLQLMQMVVVERFRGKCIGRGLVEELIAFTLAEHCREIVCHARQEAVGFYDKLGFCVYDDPFDEAGIVHRHMRYKLSASKQHGTRL